MRHLVLVFLLIGAGQALAQPVTITFTIGSELATEMDSLTSEYVITPQGPYHYRKIKKMAFQVNLPDSAVVQQLQRMDISVYLRYKRVAPIVLKPVVIVPVRSTLDSTTTTVLDSTQTSARVYSMTVARPPREYKATSAAGIGLGLDYGGIGMKVTFAPTGPVSIFGGIGYNFATVGFNAGLELNFAPKERTSAFVSAMYGYNGVLIQPYGSTKSSETFYGPSFGFGARSWARDDDNFFTVQVILPIRDEAFLNAPTTEKPWPVLISFGYHFGK